MGKAYTCKGCVGTLRNQRYLLPEGVEVIWLDGDQDWIVKYERDVQACGIDKHDAMYYFMRVEGIIQRETGD